MNEKDIARLEELSEKKERSPEENSELADLLLKKQKHERGQETVSEITKGFKEITEELKKLVAEVHKNPVPVDREEELLRTDKNFQASAFLIACRNKDFNQINKIHDITGTKAVTAAALQSNDADGGYLVPILTDASIRELVATYAQALRLFTVIPMGGNTVRMPKTTTGVTWNWPGEASTIGASKPVIGIDTLTPVKGAGIVPISNELFRRANPAMGAYVLRLFAQAEGYAIDGKMFQNAATTFTGVFYASNTFGATQTLAGSNPDTLSYRNLVDCALGVDLNYNPNPGWHLSRSMLAVCLGILDLQNRPIFDYNTRTMLGYRVEIIEQAPTSAQEASKPVILFGNLINSMIGDVEERYIDVSKEGSVTINGSYVSMFENDLSAIRVIKSYASAVGFTQAYSICKTKAT